MNQAVRRTTVAALSLFGAAGLAVSAGAGTGSAATADAATCTADQLSTILVPGDPGAGQRFADIEFVAHDGVTCQLSGILPITLPGAPDVTVADDTPGTTVTLTSGQQAHMLLHWSAIDDPQERPTSVVVTTAGADLVTPWTLGAMDANPDGAHTVFVRGIEPGPTTT